MNGARRGPGGFAPREDGTPPVSPPQLREWDTAKRSPASCGRNRPGNGKRDASAPNPTSNNRKERGVATVVMALGSRFEAVEFEETRRSREPAARAGGGSEGGGRALRWEEDSWRRLWLHRQQTGLSAQPARSLDGRWAVGGWARPVWFEGGTLGSWSAGSWSGSEYRKQQDRGQSRGFCRRRSRFRHNSNIEGAGCRSQVAGGKVACDFKKSNRFSNISTGSSAPTRGSHGSI